MRQIMPHRTNIGIEGCSYKSFLRPIPRVRLSSRKAERQFTSNFASNLRFSLIKTMFYVNRQPAGEGRAAAVRDSRHAMEAWLRHLFGG